MGCDAYASEIGEFVLIVRNYRTGERLGVIKLEDLAPKEKIAIEITEGEER